MIAENIAVAPPRPKSRRPWYKQLWVQVLVAMAVGVMVGHFYPTLGISLQPLGDGFIKLIRMLIAPIVFCSVVLGIAKMGDMSKVGKVAIKNDRAVAFVVGTPPAAAAGKTSTGYEIGMRHAF